MRKIKIAVKNMAADFENYILFKIIGTFCSYTLTNVHDCDLLIIGPHQNKKLTFKKIYDKFYKSIFINRKYKPISIFYTYENTRWNHIAADFSFSFDLGVKNANHFRLPYWMESLNWEHEGLKNRKNIRYGRLIEINELMTGINLKNKIKDKVCLFSTHLNEPRLSLLISTKEHFPVDCYGPAFDKSILDHNSSTFKKKDILAKYKYSLCPENSTYPGYITEKIVEVFASNTIPITWIDPNFSVDFNPKSVINLYDDIKNDYKNIKNLIQLYLNRKYYEQPLLLKKPSLEKTFLFVRKIINDIN